MATKRINSVVVVGTNPKPCFFRDGEPVVCLVHQARQVEEVR